MQVLPIVLTHLIDRDGEIPRFLFRGFSKRSGGNPDLNTPTAITPHAFYGIPKPTQVDSSWLGSAITAVFGPRRQFSPPKPAQFQDMSWHRLRKEICGHLSGTRTVNSHFSSWTADLQTAMDFASRGPSPHIGVLDTRKRHKDNRIMHVLALWDAGLSTYRFHAEYLVYGPVQGNSYTCMTLAWQIYPADLCLDLWAMLFPDTKLAHTLKARNRTARHSFYRAGDTWLTSLFGTCGDWSLILTVIAAEWGRSKVGASRRRFGQIMGARFDIPGSEEMRLIVSDLSWLIELAARSPNLVLPLYNPNTYKTVIFQVLNICFTCCRISSGRSSCYALDHNLDFFGSLATSGHKGPARTGRSMSRRQLASPKSARRQHRVSEQGEQPPAAGDGTS